MAWLGRGTNGVGQRKPRFGGGWERLKGLLVTVTIQTGIQGSEGCFPSDWAWGWIRKNGASWPPLCPWRSCIWTGWGGRGSVLPGTGGFPHPAPAPPGRRWPLV